MPNRSYRSSERRVVLREYETSPGVLLSAEDRDALAKLHPGLRIQPAGSGRFFLTPDQHIGVIRSPGITVEIRPKISMRSALFLISHATRAVRWHTGAPGFSEDATFTDIVSIMLARLVESATHRGVVHGYRETVASEQAPKGRILFNDLIGRRFGRAPPIDVRQDEYTTDVTENQVLLSALHAMRGLRPTSDSARRLLANAQLPFGGVELVHFSREHLPDVDITALNAHYEDALSLALIVLASTYLGLGAGATSGIAFLVDMNVVFERFVRNALRAALGVDRHVFPDVAPKAHMDVRSMVRIKPDLTYLRQRRVVWVGDAKYKILPASRPIQPDLYQLHSYCIAMGLSEGVLVYGTANRPRRVEHRMRGSDVALRIFELNVNASPAELTMQVEGLAAEVRSAIQPR